MHPPFLKGGETIFPKPLKGGGSQILFLKGGLRKRGGGSRIKGGKAGFENVNGQFFACVGLKTKLVIVLF